MFGISFGKLLLLGLLVAAVWFGFRYLQGLGRDRTDDALRKPAPQSPKASSDAAAARAAQPAGHAEDLTKCPVCGTYVARGAPSCGRGDCPPSRFAA